MSDLDDPMGLSLCAPYDAIDVFHRLLFFSSAAAEGYSGWVGMNKRAKEHFEEWEKSGIAEVATNGALTFVRPTTKATLLFVENSVERH